MIYQSIVVNDKEVEIKELKRLSSCMYVCSSIDCVGVKIGCSRNMYKRVESHIGKALVRNLCFYIIIIDGNVDRWEKFIHSWLRNFLIAGEVFNLTHNEVIFNIKQCLNLDCRSIWPKRSKYFEIFLNGVKQVYILLYCLFLV